MEVPTTSLTKAIWERNWGEISRILKDHPESAKEELSAYEYYRVYLNAPSETMGVMIKAWPEVFVEKMSIKKEWTLLDMLFRDYPQVLETKHAKSIAIENGASLEFVTKHWKETGVLLYAVYSKDWGKFGEMLNDNLHLVKEALSKHEFKILWKDAPLETIRILLEAWPEAYEMKDDENRDLVETKLYEQEWDFMRSILPSCPNSITAGNMYSFCVHDGAPLDLFKLMLDQQPNAPLNRPGIIFKLIENNKLEHFCAMLDRYPSATELKEERLQLTPLLCIFQNKEQINMDWIGPILQADPSAAMEKDFDGKTPLHLSYQHGASSQLIDMMQQADPEAENKRDNLGRFPKDLANQSENAVFTTANETIILTDNLNDKKPYPDNAVVVQRGDMLIRDPQLPQNKEDKETYENYSGQVAARDRIFGTLLGEFSKMVGIDDKDVIQKAAAIQALAAQCLLNKNGTVINFGKFENPGYWFQQEML